MTEKNLAGQFMNKLTMHTISFCGTLIWERKLKVHIEGIYMSFRYRPSERQSRMQFCTEAISTDLVYRFVSTTTEWKFRLRECYTEA